MSKFRAPQPLELSAALKRIADRATILGTDLQFALIGHDGHPEVNELRDLSIDLGRRTYELAARLKREATTPPPPEEEKHPLFDSPAKRSGCYVALMGRNPLFWLAAIDPVQARKILDDNRPDSSAWTIEEWEEATIKARDLPFFPVWSQANPLPAPDPKVPARRPAPAKPEPGEKLGKRQCWIAKVAGRPAFRIYAHAKELAEGQLAHKVPRDSWPEASIALEFTNRSQDFNGVPMLSDLSPERARGQVLLRLAEAEHESGSGFVAPMAEEPPTKVAEAQPETRTFIGTHKATNVLLFWLQATDLAEAEDVVAMGLPRAEFEAIALAELPAGETTGNLPDFESFDPEDMPEDDELDKFPREIQAVRLMPEFPTESPRDPLATLPIAELDLRKPVLELLTSRGIATAGQLFDELDGEVLDGLLTEEQEQYIRQRILRWEGERMARIVADGSWIDEELTYAAFRLGDAATFWAGLREQGATDAQLRDAINKRFFVMGGAETAYRAGYHFISGPAPAFFCGSARPKRGQEPALEGKHLIDAVRRLLAIRTREEPAAAKPSKRKAVKA